MKTKFATLALLAAISGAGVTTVLVAQNQSNPPAAEARVGSPLEGTVKGFNRGPRGEAEGLILDVGGKPAQVNVPPHVAEKLMPMVKAGQMVSLTAESERAEGDHPVYELVSVTKVDGQAVTIDTAPPAPQHLEGTIASLNYARRGEVNGFTLSSGEFVHVGPDAEDLKLAAGAKVTVDGPVMTTPDGTKIVRADKVNDKEIEKPRPPKGGPKGPKHDGPKHDGPGKGPRGDGPDKGPAGEREPM